MLNGINRNGVVVGYYNDDNGLFRGFVGALEQNGDVNLDGLVDAQDIDLLTAAIREGDSDDKFDIDQSGEVNSDDFTAMIRDVLNTVPGDANLDGFVDGSDFNIWNDNKFLSPTGWSMADFTGDGSTLADDFDVWQTNRFASANMEATVPEPTFAANLTVVVWAFLLVNCRLRTHKATGGN